MALPGGVDPPATDGPPTRPMITIARTAPATERRIDCRRRPVRVGALLVAVVALSIGDLYMTLVHLRSVGMIEANPLAREVIDLNSPHALAAWKLATVLVAVSLLFLVRRTRSGEAGAWLAVAVLTWLMLHWITYSDALVHLHPEFAVDAARNDPNWVAMAPGD